MCIGGVRVGFKVKGRREMESKAKMRGHPIHPILVPFPLGLLTTSVIFDVIHLFTGGSRWAEISFWMIAAGVIGGLLVALFASSWLLRSGTPGDPGVLPIVLSFLGVGLASLGGFLGGELVFRLGIGVAEGANPNASGSSSLGPERVRGAPGRGEGC